MNSTKPFNTESSKQARETLERQRTQYKKEYLDDEYWTELAKNVGERMPPYYTAPSDSDIKYWLRICGVPYNYFVDAYGWENAREFERLNPNHSMKVIAGLILELMEERKRLKRSSRARADSLDANVGDHHVATKLYRGESKANRRKRTSQNVSDT